MKKSQYIGVGMVAFVLMFLIVLEASKKPDINWGSSYHKVDKIPMGGFVFYETFKNWVGASRFEEINIPPYEFIDSDPEPGTYFFFNSSVYFDQSETRKILNWVEEGNTLFISAHFISPTLMDSLGLELRPLISLDQLENQPLFQLTNPRLKQEKPFHFDKDIDLMELTRMDTANSLVLGEFDVRNEEDFWEIAAPKVNFIRKEMGKGQVYFHTFPAAFSNYFLMKGENLSYMEGLLAYLPEEGAIYYDNHYKDGKSFFSSPLYVLLNDRYLRMAYYLVLVMALLWVIFEGKRKQKSIPVIPPVRNQTLAFTQTIAGMYLEKKAHKTMATHQINHFMEYLRNHLRISTEERGADWVRRVAEKSQNEQDFTRDLFEYIDRIEAEREIAEGTLIHLNKKIEAFKK
ncbi:DUF4350 domain-containing protein [Pararhodonellum marinum]|uniref:DUF4350 domain-containing protein n=1 Tax=Pararhodonellum marinum TaxID=2755358 RepID=UPI00188E8AE7|nr:DUF4350 domain-containing protein [Pararhodonellum marinum]